MFIVDFKRTIRNGSELGLILVHIEYRFLNSLFYHANFGHQSLRKSLSFPTQKDGDIILHLKTFFLSQFLNTVDHFSGHTFQFKSFILATVQNHAEIVFTF